MFEHGRKMKHGWRMVCLIMSLTMMMGMITASDAMAASSKGILDIKNESYISEYSLATNGFFESDVWSVLDADCRAFILESTTNNESNRYGISPRIGVYAESLEYSFENEDTMPDKSSILRCDRTTFSWNEDESYLYILIDRKFLSELDAQDALFVCHKAFYYVYARHLVDLLDQNQLPIQFRECVDQIEQYREDLALHDNGDTYVCTMLEEDAIAFGISGSRFYYSYIFPEDTDTLSDGYLRVYWQDCLNGIYKEELLQRLVDELSEAFRLDTTYRIVASDADLELYKDENQETCEVVFIDKAILEEGDVFDCIKPLVEAMFSETADYSHLNNPNKLDLAGWRRVAYEESWYQIKKMLRED